MIKNLKFTEDFKKRIVAGGLGLVLMTSAGALGVGIHNAKEIKKLTKQQEESASVSVDFGNYLTEYEQEKGQLEKKIADLKAQKEALQHNDDKQFKLKDIYIARIQNQDGEEYCAVTRGASFSRAEAYVSYAVGEDISDEEYLKLVNEFVPSVPGEDVIFTYNEVHGNFYAVSSDTVNDPLVQDYVRYDEIASLSTYLTEGEEDGMIFEDELFGKSVIYLSDVERVLSRINAEKKGRSIIKKLN